MPSCDGERGFVAALCRLLLPAAGFLAASWLPLRHGSGRLRLFAARLAQLSPLALPDGQPLQRGLVGASVLAPVPDAPPPQLHPLHERRPLRRFWDQSEAEVLPLRLPSGLLPSPPPPPRKPPAVEVDTGSVTVSTGCPQPVQLVRVVPPSGNLTVAQQQVWLGPALAGTPVTIWVDTDRLHVLTADGARIKSSPSRLSQRDLARLLADGGGPAGPPPLPQPEPHTTAVEVDRIVNACGGISIAGRQISVGIPLAGQRVRIRVDGILLHVIDNAGQLRRTLRCPFPPTALGRIRDARPASAVPPPAAAPEVERVVSINGSIQVAGQKIQVGKVHARKLVTVALDEHIVTIYDAGIPIAAVARRSTTDLNRTKAKHQMTVTAG